MVLFAVVAACDVGDHSLAIAQSQRLLPPQLPAPQSSRSAHGLSPLPNNEIPTTANQGSSSRQQQEALLTGEPSSNQQGRAKPSSLPQDSPSAAGPSSSGQWDSRQLVSSGIARLDTCSVQLIQQIELPAREPGPLSEVLTAEGETIAKGQVLASIDDEQARTDLSVAAAKLEASELKVSSDIAIRYAQAGYNAAEKTYQRELRLSRRGAGTEADADEARLLAIQAQLQIEKAQHDYQVEQKSINVEKLEVLKAKELLQRHAVVAPWGGIVRKIFKRQGEWANAGDPIIEMIQMDRLWVEGEVAVKEINPYQVSHRPVTVTMTLADGEAIAFPGKIVFVDPEIVGRYYKVRAEVINRTHQNHWLLIPGMKVQMEIELLPAGPVESVGQQTLPSNG